MGSVGSRITDSHNLSRQASILFIIVLTKLGLLRHWIILALSRNLHRMLDLFLGYPRQYLVAFPPLLCLHYDYVFLRFHMIINIVQLLLDFLFMEHDGLFCTKLCMTKQLQKLLRILSKIFRLKITVPLTIFRFWYRLARWFLVFLFIIYFWVALASQDPDILVILCNKLRTRIQSSLVGRCLLFVECFLPNLLYKPLCIFYKVGIALTMQVSVPALRELDTFVNAEVLPLLQDHCLLLCVTCTKYIELFTGISRAKLVLINHKFHEKTNFFNCL